MSFYRFSQISGRLTPSQQLKAVAPQGLTPANKVKHFPEVRTNFPDMFRFRSTFNLSKAAKPQLSGPHASGPARGASSSSLPTEFTATGFPKFPPGTRIGKDLVMGKYGPFSPKIRQLQEVFQSHPELPVFLKKGASDRMIHNILLAIFAFQVFVVVPFTVYTLSFNAGPFKRLMGLEKKESSEKDVKE